eukprot:213518_1
MTLIHYLIAHIIIANSFLIWHSNSRIWSHLQSPKHATENAAGSDSVANAIPQYTEYNIDTLGMILFDKQTDSMNFHGFPKFDQFRLDINRSNQLQLKYHVELAGTSPNISIFSLVNETIKLLVHYDMPLIYSLRSDYFVIYTSHSYQQYRYLNNFKIKRDDLSIYTISTGWLYHFSSIWSHRQPRDATDNTAGSDTLANTISQYTEYNVDTLNMILFDKQTDSIIDNTILFNFHMHYFSKSDQFVLAINIPNQLRINNNNYELELAEASIFLLVNAITESLVYYLNNKHSITYDMAIIYPLYLCSKQYTSHPYEQSIFLNHFEIKRDGKYIWCIECCYVNNTSLLFNNPTLFPSQQYPTISPFINPVKSPKNDSVSIVTNQTLQYPTTNIPSKYQSNSHISPYTYLSTLPLNTQNISSKHSTHIPTMLLTINPSNDSSNTYTQTPYITTLDPTNTSNTSIHVMYMYTLQPNNDTYISPSSATTFGTIQPTKIMHVTVTNVPIILKTANMTNMTQTPSNITLLTSIKYPTFSIINLVSSNVTSPSLISSNAAAILPTSILTFYSTVNLTNISSTAPTKEPLFITATATTTVITSSYTCQTSHSMTATSNITNVTPHSFISINPNCEEQSANYASEMRWTLHATEDIIETGRSMSTVAASGSYDEENKCIDVWNKTVDNIVPIDNTLLLILLVTWIIVYYSSDNKNQTKIFLFTLCHLVLYFIVVSSQTVNTMQKILPSDGAANDNFGNYQVSIDGTTYSTHAIVGAVNNDDQGTNSGSAYIFTLDSVNNAWTETAKLLPSDGAAYDLFGIAVSIYGTHAI